MHSSASQGQTNGQSQNQGKKIISQNDDDSDSLSSSSSGITGNS
jgi:hypothetical protein